jgi:hypothetical protein
MKTLVQDCSSQNITRTRKIGFLVYPDCEILDVCGPFDAFFHADAWLPRFGRADDLPLNWAVGTGDLRYHTTGSSP